MHDAPLFGQPRSPQSSVQRLPEFEERTDPLSAAEHERPLSKTIAYHDGEGDIRSICTEKLEGGDRVCRLRRRHLFHPERWDRLLANATRTECPNCGGAGMLTAV